MTISKRRLQKTNKNQYLLTIPKRVIRELGWQDKAELAFRYEKNTLTLTQAQGVIMRRLQRTNKDQYLLTMPKTLIAVAGWLPKDVITFTQQERTVILARGGRQ